MIIDTHCHLDSSKFDEDLEEVLQRAYDSGVRGFILPGADPKDLPKAQKIAHEHDNMYFAAGVHPYHAREYDETYLKEFLSDPKCIAVGECGMDYFRLPEDEGEKAEEKAVQQEVFAKHIRLANRHGMPLIIHIREANDISKQIMLENDAKDAVLHCYNASPHLLDLSKRNCYFGIGGVATFKNAKKLVEILPEIPLEKLLLETDAPYLTPHPYRGKRNEPAYTTYVLEKIAQTRHMETEVLEKQILDNTKTLFKAFATLDSV